MKKPRWRKHGGSRGPSRKYRRIEGAFELPEEGGFDQHRQQVYECQCGQTGTMKELDRHSCLGGGSVAPLSFYVGGCR